MGLHAAEVSLFISIELPDIPSLTTLLPFRDARFISLRVVHRRRRRTTPAEIIRHPELGHIVGPCAIRGSPFARRLPDRLGQIEFACATDYPFASGCSPPFLLKTQLPSATGR